MPAPTNTISGANVLSLETSDQIEIFETFEYPQPFLRQLLFPREIVFQSVAVQISYKRFRRSLAPFVARYQQGRILPTAPQSSQMIELPQFGPTRNILADDALVPSVNGVWVSPNSVDLVASLTAQNWSEMEASHAAREEFLISNLLQTGVIDLHGDEGANLN